MKKIVGLVMVVLLVAAGSVHAINWDGSDSDAWATGANWSTNAAPTGSVIAQVGTSTTVGPWPVVTTATAVCKGLTVGSSSVAELTIASGGTLTPTGAVTIADAGSSAYTATITVNSGGLLKSVIASKWIEVGKSAFGKGVLNVTGGTVDFSGSTGSYIAVGNAAGGNGEINANSGTISCASYLEIGKNASSKGLVNLSNGSTVTLGSLVLDQYSTAVSGKLYIDNSTVTTSLDSSDTLKMGANALIELKGTGKMILKGDRTTGVQNYISALKIKGFGGATVMYDYNTSNAGMTTVYIPEPATMVLLGLGSLLFARRKR